LTAGDFPPPLAAKPDIPAAVWNNVETLCMDLEIYLRNGGVGSRE